MTSALLDAALCLLFVSAAVTTVTTVEPREPDSGRAADALGVVAATTVTVAYTPADPTGANGSDDGVDARRAHGTVAELLARAAVVDASDATAAERRRPTGFVERVERAAAGTVGSRVHVVAVWEPYPGAHVAGRAVAGTRPPADAAVSAATMTVPSRFPEAIAAPQAGDGGPNAAESSPRVDDFDGVADAVASAVVAGWFPPDAVGETLRAGGPSADRVRRRYRLQADAYDVDATRVEAALDRGAPTRANRVLAGAVADRVERDLRLRFDSPATATRTVDTGRVTVTVRTWSA